MKKILILFVFLVVGFISISAQAANIPNIMWDKAAAPVSAIGGATQQAEVIVPSIWFGYSYGEGFFDVYWYCDNCISTRHKYHTSKLS